MVRAKRFELVDDDGHTRAVIGRLGDGSPHVILADDKGQMRCAIWLAPNGTPSVTFFDANSRRSWIAA